MESSASATTQQVDIGSLAAALSGEVIGADHPGYDRHRAVWNGAIDRRPAVIARCADSADVIATIQFARRTGLELAVRSGGHSFPGLSVADGAVVLDTSLMKRVDVDPDRRSVRVQAGVLLGEMDAATAAHGLAVPTGAVTHTGVAGLTLGGGIGWLMRRHGLAIDQLRSAQVVTLDGRVLTASAEVNPELFWGLRGGGGNFGVVTEFEFTGCQIGPTVVSGMVLWSADDAPAVTARYRQWCEDAPDDLTSSLVLRRAPSLDVVPAALHGEPVVGVIGCWAGPLDAGDEFWAPLRQFGTPMVDLTARRPYVEHQAMMDASFPHGRHVYMKACDVAGLSDEVLDVIVAHASKMRSPYSSFIAWQLGGAVAAVPDDSTSFGSRQAGFIVNITGITDGQAGFEDERAWVRDFWADLLPHQTSVYVNFLNDADTDRVRTAYGPERFERLQVLKRAYDPDNILHLNQNVPPE